MAETLFDLLGRSGEPRRAAALESVDGAAATSYAELRGVVESVAGVLASRGIGRGDCVAILLPNGPQAAACFLGVACAATAAPLNPAFRSHELDYYFEDLRPAAVIVPPVTPAPVLAVAESRGIPVLVAVSDPGASAGVFGLVGENAPVLQPAPRPDDVALVLHTSGTTARPKIVPLTHGNLCASAANVAASLALTAADRCLGVMPLFHIHGLVAALAATLDGGGTVICTGGFDAPAFLALVRSTAATWYTAVPTMHQAVLARAVADPAAVAGHRLRFVRSSSAALAPAVLEGLEGVFSVPVVEAYGMTEAAHQMCSNPLPPQVRKTGSVGPAAGPEVVVLDDEGQRCELGSVGEVGIAGANVMGGYRGQGASTGEALDGGWFRTGDLGRFDADGYLFLTGRRKEIINRGGETISPREIDETMLEHAAVASAVAFAVPDPRVGEEVGIVVVCREGESLSERDVRAFLGERLSDAKVPRVVRFLDEIPLGPTGKVQRIGLAAKLGIDGTGSAAASASTAFEAPRTKAEIRLAALWCAALDVDVVGRRDEFFALGGDSLNASRVLEDVRREFGVDVRMFAFYESPTLAGLAAGIEAAAESAPSAVSSPVSGATETALTGGEQRIWVHARLHPDSRAYHYVRAARVEGDLDPAALRAALEAVVQRHERLRTTFHEGSAGAVARVHAAAAVSFRCTDLSALPPGDRERRCVEIQREENAVPCDLERGPLLRAHLLRLGELRHLLLVPIHHIVYDGTSLPVFWADLSAAYGSAARGEPVPGPLPFCFGELVDRMRAWVPVGELDRQRAHWQGVFEAPPQLVSLVTDRDRPEPATESGAQRASTLSAEVTTALRAYAAARRTTRYRVALAAFFALLHRYTGATDLVVGTQAANRGAPDATRVVAMMTNTVPIRVWVEAGMSFDALVERVRAATDGAYAATDLSYEEIVRLAGGTAARGGRLFTTAFQFRNWKHDFTAVGAPRFIDVEVDDGVVRAELEVLVVDAAGELQPHVKYRRDLFHAETVDRLLGHYQQLLAAALDEPKTAIEDLLLCPEAGLASLRGPAAKADCATLHGLLLAQAERCPDAVALDGFALRGATRDDGVPEAGAERVGYAELVGRAHRVAHALRRRGVGCGDIVGLSVERSNEMLVAIVGILAAGAAYLPLVRGLPQRRRAAMLREVGARVTVTHGVAPIEGQQCLDLDHDHVEIQAYPGAAVEVSVEPTDPCYVIYTSGSTGAPKGVVVEHRNAVNHARATAALFELRPGDRVLLFSTIGFDMAVEQIFPTLHAGATVVLDPEGPLEQPEEFAAAVARRQISVLNLPTAVWSLLVGQLGDGLADLAGALRLLIVGGEAVRPAAYRDWRAQVGDRIRWLNTYGPTEATVTATWHDPLQDPAAWEEDGRVPIGRPLPGVGVEVCDARGRVVPVGVPGELHLRGAGVARGYVHEPEGVEPAFTTDAAGCRCYRSGDRVRMRADGNLEFLGRLDDQIKLRGFRVEPGEVEQALLGHPNVREAVVVARHRGSELELVGYVAASGVDEFGLREYLCQHLPAHAIPTRCVVVDVLAKNRRRQNRPRCLATAGRPRAAGRRLGGASERVRARDRPRLERPARRRPCWPRR